MKLIFPPLSDVDKIKEMKFPSKLSNSLSEFVGIHIGDGHLAYHKDQSEYFFQVCGHQIKDKIYYDIIIYNLLKKLFNIDRKPKYFSSKTYGYQIYSKGLFYFLWKNFKVPDGKKTHTVRIPKIFFKENKFMKHCLRGIIDTDFYFYIQKDKGPIVGAWFASRDLVIDLQHAFHILGIKSSIMLDDFYIDKRTGKKYIRHRILIRGKNQVNKWFEVIGTHHPLFLCKYTNWKRGINLKDIDILNNPKLLDNFALVDSSSAKLKFGTANVV